MERTEVTTIEKNIISSISGWDELDFMAIQFYDAELALDIPGFGSKGDIFECVSFDYNKGIIQFHYGTDYKEFQLDLVLTKTLSK